MRKAVTKRIASVSVKGLANCARAKRLHCQLFWLMLFIAAMVAFGCHLGLLIGRYREYPTNTKLAISAVDFQFPSLFACNPFPVSASWLAYNEFYNISKEKHEEEKEFEKNFFSKFNSVQKLISQSVLEGKNILGLRRGFDISFLYSKLIWSSWTRNMLRLIQPTSIDQFVIKASINGVNLGIDAFEAISSQEYFKCFRFLNSSSLKNPSDVLSIYFYTDATQLNIEQYKSDMQKIASMVYSGPSVVDKSSGLLLFFTEAGHYPSANAEQLTVSSGSHTKITVKMTAKLKMSLPSLPCRKQAAFVTLASHLINGAKRTYRLDRSLCEAYEWALEYYTQCGCVPLRYPMPAHVKFNTSRCLNITHWSVDEIANKIACISKVEFDLNIKQAIILKCEGVEPCETLTYDVHWSNALWPTESLVTALTEKIINTTYQERKRENRSVFGWRNVLNAPDKNNMTRMIRENIAKVDIRPRSSRSSKLLESPAYPAINLFSDIGGILGLYLGISLLSLMELVASVISALHDFSKKRISSRKTQDGCNADPAT